MTNHPNWYLSKIKQFVNVGFFDGADEKDIESIAQRIIEDSEISYFGNILHLQNEANVDYILVSYDQKRVWWVEDWMTYGSTQENDHRFYFEVLEQLSDISGGVFKPTEIKIEPCGYCDGRDKRISVAFQLDNEMFDVNFCIDGSVLVLSFLEEINEILEPRGFSFEHIFGRTRKTYTSR